MLTKKERTLLRQASDLIVKQLTETGEASIHGFGKFYLSRVEVAKGVHESGLPAEATGMKHRNVVRFRPWEGLKRHVNNGEVQVTNPDHFPMKDYKACVYCEASIPAGSTDCPECGLPQEE